MKKILLVLVLVMVSFSTIACTLTETAQQRKRRYRQITDLETRMMVEDWDTIWLYERSSGATQWHPWIGI